MELKLLTTSENSISALTFNRTLWNWNLVTSFCATRFWKLLIVPYGIETWKNVGKVKMVRLLLIVPYGIETAADNLDNDIKKPFNRTLWNWNVCRSAQIHAQSHAFNRTLWNWNLSSSHFLKSLHSFNRTLWNWNSGHSRIIEAGEAFNRTLWNWNEL